MGKRPHRRPPPSPPVLAPIPDATKHTWQVHFRERFGKNPAPEVEGYPGELDQPRMRLLRGAVVIALSAAPKIARK
jgi:hypothetical protein